MIIAIAIVAAVYFVFVIHVGGYIIGESHTDS